MIWTRSLDISRNKEQGSLNAARKWFSEIMASIASLQELPARCPIAPESEEFTKEVRLLFHGKNQRTYKIFYSINYETPSIGSVQVFHIRHWARKSVDGDELEELMTEVSDREEDI